MFSTAAIFSYLSFSLALILLSILRKFASLNFRRNGGFTTRCDICPNGCVPLRGTAVVLNKLFFRIFTTAVGRHSLFQYSRFVFIPSSIRIFWRLRSGFPDFASLATFSTLFCALRDLFPSPRYENIVSCDPFAFRSSSPVSLTSPPPQTSSLQAVSWCDGMQCLLRNRKVRRRKGKMERHGQPRVANIIFVL